MDQTKYIIGIWIISYNEYIKFIVCYNYNSVLTLYRQTSYLIYIFVYYIIVKYKFSNKGIDKYDNLLWIYYSVETLNFLYHNMHIKRMCTRVT